MRIFFALPQSEICTLSQRRPKQPATKPGQQAYRAGILQERLTMKQTVRLNQDRANRTSLPEFICLIRIFSRVDLCDVLTENIPSYNLES